MSTNNQKFIRKFQILQRILADGTHVPFSKISGLTDEVKIATVKAGSIGGFTTGDLFTGNGVDGQIVRITNNAQTVHNPWVDFPGKDNGLMRGSLFIDDVGTFDGDLVVVTNQWSLRSVPGTFVTGNRSSAGRFARCQGSLRSVLGTCQALS